MSTRFSLDPNVEQLFEKMVRQLSLGDVAEKIRAVTRPALGVTFGAFDGAVGTSRIGGEPDLPHGVAWPVARASRSTPSALTGRKMTFVAQIRGEDIARVPGCPLPKTGLLSFFLGADESANDIDHVVMWNDANATELTRAPLPAKEDVVNDHYHPFFPAFAMQLTPIATLPSFTRDTSMDASADKLRELAAALSGKHDARVLGHPSSFANDVVGHAYMRANGKTPVYPYLNIDAKVNPFTRAPMPGPMVSAEERAAIEWFRADLANNERRMMDIELLLQIESRPGTTMSFWDAGVLQFSGDDQAFARRDFSGTYASIQTG